VGVLLGVVDREEVEGEEPAVIVKRPLPRRDLRIDQHALLALDLLELALEPLDLALSRGSRPRRQQDRGGGGGGRDDGEGVLHPLPRKGD
jgi:hypothetical protein